MGGGLGVDTSDAESVLGGGGGWMHFCGRHCWPKGSRGRGREGEGE